MKIQEVQQGKEYILKSDVYSRYPKIEKVLIVDKTKTSIKIKFESGYEKRYELSYFENEYRVLEEIETNTNNLDYGNTKI